jgi:hypothetical protein
VPVAEDPVAVYDVMRDTANRVVAVYASRVTVGGVADPAVQAISDFWAEVDAVDARDLAAQKIATTMFRKRFEALVAE